MGFAHSVRTAHRHRARQELEQIADRLAAAADGHGFQHFGDQNEQGDDERGKKLAIAAAATIAIVIDSSIVMRRSMRFRRPP